MGFKEVISREIGVRGIVPDGWSSTGYGMVDRKASPEDPSTLAQRVLPQADIDSVLAFLPARLVWNPHRRPLAGLQRRKPVGSCLPLM